jgi:hypothetical protein
VICQPCKDGGVWNKLGNKAGAPVLPVNGNAYRLNAFQSHERCKEPVTCPCQHKIGIYLNPQPRKDER